MSCDQTEGHCTKPVFPDHKELQESSEIQPMEEPELIEIEPGRPDVNGSYRPRRFRRCYLPSEMKQGKFVVTQALTKTITKKTSSIRKSRWKLRADGKRVLRRFRMTPSEVRALEIEYANDPDWDT